MSTLEQHLNRQAERSRSFFWNRLRWNLVCEQLPRSEGSAVVDVGAGPGFLGDLLGERYPGVSYRFIEPLAGLEKSLEERFGAAANLRDRESFGDARLVTLLDVLEHQEDDRRFLRELSQKMAPGSELVLTVPAMPSLWSDWDIALGHYRRYKKETLLAAADGLPFEVRELSYVFPELLPLGWLRRAKMRSGSARESETSAEFPDLPAWLNDLLYGCGKVSMAMRRRWPAGTSLYAILTRTG